MVELLSALMKGQATVQDHESDPELMIVTYAYEQDVPKKEYLQAKAVFDKHVIALEAVDTDGLKAEHEAKVAALKTEQAKLI